MFTTLNAFYNIKSCFKLESRGFILPPWCLCFTLTLESETPDLKSQLCFSSSFPLYKPRRENFLSNKIHGTVVPFVPKLILKQIWTILNFLVYRELLLLFHYHLDLWSKAILTKSIFFFKYIYWLCYYSCPIPPPLHSILPTPLPPTFPPHSSCP